MTEEVISLEIRYTKENDCWRFFGAHDYRGYGRISVDGKQQQVQRIIWQSLVGDLPAGKRVKTTCGTRDCVLIEHLYLAEKPEAKERSERTHCQAGLHEYSGSNVMQQKGGTTCRKCAEARWKRRNERRKYGLSK